MSISDPQNQKPKFMKPFTNNVNFPWIVNEHCYALQIYNIFLKILKKFNKIFKKIKNNVKNC